jgi:glycosyltransferase involved in cell wall biosynthesis
LGVVVCDLAVDPVHWAEANKPSACETFDMESINGKKKTVGSRLILHVGRMASLERYKGQEVLLRSFPVIKQKYPEAQLLLAGRGDDRERLLSLARSLPSEIQCDVFMPGYVDDNTLRELYKSCFVFAMPSIGEGFGLVYLEAMAYAKPCLGGNVDATPCVIKNGVTGLLVDDPRNDVQVAECLLRFFDDPPAANEMGQAGYKLLCEYYLPGHFVERFWRALEINR